jgi:hypothetical protein
LQAAHTTASPWVYKFALPPLHNKYFLLSRQWQKIRLRASTAFHKENGYAEKNQVPVGSAIGSSFNLFIFSSYYCFRGIAFHGVHR